MEHNNIRHTGGKDTRQIAEVLHLTKRLHFKTNLTKDIKIYTSDMMKVRSRRKS